MLAVAIVGVITQIVVIGYEMGPMIVEKAQSAVAIFKRIFWFVAKRTCGWEPSEDGDEESGGGDKDEESASSPGKGSAKVVAMS